MAMILLHLSFHENFNIFGGLYITQLNICDGAFIVKIASHKVYSQKITIRDGRLGSKYIFTFKRLFKKFY